MIKRNEVSFLFSYNESSMNRKKIVASIMLILAPLLWGLSYSFQSMSTESLGSFSIVFFKGIGSIVLLPILIFQKRRFNFRSVRGGILIGLFVFLGCFFQQLGIKYSTISKASFITALYILFVPLIQIFMGKKVSVKIWLSVFVAAVGLYFLCMHSDTGINKGDFFLLAGSVMFALQIIAIDYYVKDCDPLVLTFVYEFSLSVFALIAVFFFEKIDLSAVKEALLPLLYLVFVSGILAQYLQTRYQKDLDPSLASLLMSFESVFGAFFGWLIMHQTLSFKEIFGCILVFLAILLAES